MSFSTKVDKGGFQGGFHAGNLSAINIGFFLFPCPGFDIQVIQALAIDKGDTQLFWLGRIDEHPFHVVSHSDACRHNTRKGRREANRAAACLCSAHGECKDIMPGMESCSADEVVEYVAKAEHVSVDSISPAQLTSPTPGIHRFANVGNRHNVEHSYQVDKRRLNYQRSTT